MQKLVEHVKPQYKSCFFSKVKRAMLPPQSETLVVPLWALRVTLLQWTINLKDNMQRSTLHVHQRYWPTCTVKFMVPKTHIRPQGVSCFYYWIWSLMSKVVTYQLQYAHLSNMFLWLDHYINVDWNTWNVTPINVTEIQLHTNIFEQWYQM